MRGYLISIEGIEASGKTMCAKYCTQVLRKMFGTENVIYTCEPTRTNIYGRLANKFLERKYQPQWEWETFFIFLADRAIHVKKLISPALDDGKIVVCDRYTHSQLAYQSAEDIPLNILKNFNNDFPVPDIVFLLDVMPRTAMNRLGDRYFEGFGVKEHFDNYETLTKVRNCYLKMQKNSVLAKAFIRINAERSQEYVLSKLNRELNVFLKFKRA